LNSGSTLSEGFYFLGEAIGTLIKVATTPLKLNDALADLSQKGTEAMARLGALSEKMGLAKPPADALTEAHKKLGTELDKGGIATASLAGEQKKQDVSAQKSKESTAVLVVHTDQANISFKNLTDAIRVTNDIQKTHDQTAISAIALAGQQKDVLQAEATAAGHAADSAQELLNVKSASLAVAQRYLDGLQQEVVGITHVGDKMRERIKLVTEDVDKKTLEVSASKAFVDAQDLAAEKTHLATETLKDNSTRVYELRTATQEATKALANANKLHDAGKISNEAYAEAVKKQRDALALYKDALSDTVTALKLKEEAEKRHTDLASKSIQVEIDIAQSAQDAAKARGDETEVIKQGLSIKNLEATQAKAVAEGKDKEAQAAQASGEARIAEIKASGDLTVEMKAEIAQIEDLIQSKQLEADSSEQSSRQAGIAVDAARALADAEKEQADALKSLADSSDQAKRGLNQIATRRIARARQQETDALAQTSQSSSQASAAAGQLNTASVNAGAVLS
jgi:hypothetical protein